MGSKVVKNEVFQILTTIDNYYGFFVWWISYTELFWIFLRKPHQKTSFLDFWQIFSCFRGGEIRQKLGFPTITWPKMVKFCSNFYQLFVLFLGHCHILTHFGQIGAPGGSKKSQKWGFSAITLPKMVKFCSNFYQIFVLFLGHCHILKKKNLAETFRKW